MAYLKNVGKSIAYSVPQVLQNKLGNIADFAKLITNSDSRKEVQDAFRTTRSILKDDYASVLTTGFDNTVKALKSGKFHDPKAAQDNFAADFGGEDGDTWGSWDDDSADAGGDSNVTVGDSEPSADAGAISSTVVRTASGLAGKLDEVSQAVIQTGEMNANMSRHALVQQINSGKASRNYYQMSLARMDRDYGFRMHVEKPFFEASLEHMTAMQGMLGEISDKLGDIRSGQAIIATATDVSTQLAAENSNVEPTVGLRSMIDASGQFSPVKYINSLNRKLQNIASDSMFGMGMNMAKGGVSGLMLDNLVEALVPKAASRRMDRVNEWFGELIPMALTRMADSGNKKLAQGGFKNTALGNVMKFFGADKKPEFDIDLSNYAKDKAVSFDGYAHRALVEVIPTLLGDSHAELVSIRKALAGEDTAKSGIKAYDYQTGKFTNTADVLKDFNDNAEALAKSNLRLFASRAGGSNTNELQDVFMRMVNNQTQFRNLDDITSFIEKQKTATGVTNDQKTSMETGLDQLKQLLTVDGTHDLRRMYDLQAAVNKGGYQKENYYRNAMDGREDVTRFAFNSMSDPSGELNSVTRRKSLEERSQDAFILSEANQYSNEANDGFTSGNLLRDRTGKMNAKSLYQAPFRVMSKFADDVQEYVNSFFFDTDRKKTKIGGFFDRFTDKLFGEDGIFTPLIKGIKDSSIVKNINDSVSKLSKWFFGDKDELTGRRSKSKFREELEKQVGALGTIIKSMMPIDKFKKAFEMGAKKVFNWFGVSSGDIDKEGGFAGYLRKSVTTQINKFTDTIFGATNSTTGMREGGVLGFVTTAARDMRNAITDKLVTPIKVALVGADGKSGFFGDFKKQFAANITKPMKEFFFGMKDADGKKLTSGFFGQLTEGFRTKLLDPFKEQASKIFNDFKAGFINNIATPFKSALFGTADANGVGGENKRGIVANISAKFGQALNYIQEKFDKWLFNPVKTFFTDPEKGIFKRINGWLFDQNNGLFRSVSKYLFDEKSGVISKLNQKLFVGKDSYFERLGNWLNDPKKGILTRLGKQLEVGVETVKIAFSDMYEKFQVKFLEPLKKEMSYIWRASVIYFKKEILNPFKKEIKASWDASKKFFKEQVFEPLKGTLQPFVEELKFQWKNMKDHFVDIMKSTGKVLGNAVNDAFMVGFGKSFTELMKENVLDPIKETLGTIKNFLTGVLKQVILAPVKMITGASNALRQRHAQMGLAYAAGNTVQDVLNAVNATTDGNKADKAKGEKGSLISRAKEKIMQRGAAAASAINNSVSSVRTNISNASNRITNAATNNNSSVNNNANSNVSSVATNNNSVTTNRTSTIINNAVNGNTSSSVQQNSKEEVNKLSSTHNFNNINNESINRTTNAVSGGGALGGVDNIPGGDPTKKKSIASQIREAITEGFAKMRGKPRKTAGTIADIADRSLEVSTNTKEIFNFMRKHLLNVGSNLEGIANVLGAKAKGGNTREQKRGFMGTLKDFMRNPLAFVTNLGRNILDKTFGFAGSVLKQAGSMIKSAVAPVINLVTTTVKTAGKVANGVLKVALSLGNIFGNLVKAAGSVLKTLSSIAATAAKMMLDVLDVAVNTAIKVSGAALEAVGTFGKLLLKGSVEVVKSLGSLAAGLLKTGVTVTNSLLKVTGGLVKAIGTATGEILKVAAGVTKAVGSMVGGALSAVFSGGGSHTLGALTPVYVVGGYLAGTDGGVKSFSEAKTEYGGSVRRITRAFKSKLFSSDGDFKEKLLHSSSLMSASLANFGKGFMATMKNLMGFLLPIGATLAKTLGLENIAKTIPKILGNGVGAGAGAAAAGAGAGRNGRTTSRAGAWARRTLGRRAGNIVNGASRVLGGAANLGSRLIRGAGLFAMGSMAGDAIGAMGNTMEDGAAKTAVKTAGRAASWAGTGAMIGSVLPGIGTGIGALIGGAAGAVYENKEAIADFSKRVWEFTKTAFTSAVSAVGNGISKIGEWLSSTWDSVSGTISGWWSSARDTIVSAFGKVSDWITNKFSNYLNEIGDFFSNPATYIANKFNSYKDSILGAYDWISEKVTGFLKEPMNEASKIAKGIADKVSSLWSGMNDSFTNAIDWFKNKFSKAKEFIFGKDNPESESSKPTPVTTSAPTGYANKGSNAYPGYNPYATKQNETPIKQHAQTVTQKANDATSKTASSEPVKKENASPVEQHAQATTQKASEPTTPVVTATATNATPVEQHVQATVQKTSETVIPVVTASASSKSPAEQHAQAATQKASSVTPSTEKVTAEKADSTPVEQHAQKASSVTPSAEKVTVEKANAPVEQHVQTVNQKASSPVPSAEKATAEKANTTPVEQHAQVAAQKSSEPVKPAVTVESKESAPIEQHVKTIVEKSSSPVVNTVNIVKEEKSSPVEQHVKTVTKKADAVKASPVDEVIKEEKSSPVEQHAQAAKKKAEEVSAPQPAVRSQESDTAGTFNPGSLMTASGGIPGYSTNPKILKTRGIRNNNLLNIEFRNQDGATVGDAGRFARFPSPVGGIEAAANQIMRYYLGYTTGTPLRSVKAIVNTWAPPNENDTKNYAAGVAKMIGVRENEILDLTKPDLMAKLIGAMAVKENSGHPYSNDMMMKGASLGITRALKGSKVDLSQIGQDDSYTTYAGTASMQNYGIPSGGSAAGEAIPTISYDFSSGRKGADAFVNKILAQNGVKETAPKSVSKVIDGGSPVASALNSSKQSEGERVKNRVSPTGDQAAIAKATSETAKALKGKDGKDSKTEVSLDDSATAANTADAVSQLETLNGQFKNLISLLSKNSNLSFAEKNKAISQAQALQTQSQNLFAVSNGSREIAAAH